MTSFIYVIGRDDGPIKIGVSGDPDKRLRNLQGGCTFRLQVLFEVEARSIEHAYAMERQAHRFRPDLRLSGEWFAMSADEGIEAVEIVMETDLAFRERAEREGVEWRP